MEPEVRYCTAQDGGRIGYATVGHGAPPLLWVPAWGFSDFQALWEYPQTRPFYAALAEIRTLIVLVRRGAGSPHTTINEFTLDEQVGDLAAVVEHAGLDRFDVFAMDDGASVAIAYAVSHPTQVLRLLLWAPYAKAGGSKDRKVASTVELVRGNWSLARRVFADLNLPSGDASSRRWVSEYFKNGFAPETVVSYLKLSAETDITSLLPQLDLPVLVMQRRGDRLTPFKVGEATAAQIRGASLLPLSGDAHAPVFGDMNYMGAVTRFLGAERDFTSTRGSGVRTVLFTDLVGHTEMMQRLGDARGREVLREHERITRETLNAHRGVEIKTDGDSSMVSFASVASAAECAVALQRAFAAREGEPLHVRMGLNAGEPIEDEGDLFGATVILAARIKDRAEAGEILIPETVRGLLSGKGFVFADRGEFVPKGFEDGVRLFEVRWRE